MDDDCIYCGGDGRDPANDYLLPCPYCDGTGGGIEYGDVEDDIEEDDIPLSLPPTAAPEVPNV